MGKPLPLLSTASDISNITSNLTSLISPRTAPPPAAVAAAAAAGISFESPIAQRNVIKSAAAAKDRGTEHVEMVHICSDGRGIRGQLFITSHRCVFVPKIMKTESFCVQFPLDSSVSIQHLRGQQTCIIVDHHKSSSDHKDSTVQFLFSGFMSDVVCVHAFQKISSIASGTNHLIAAAAAGVAVLSPLAFAWGSTRDLVHSANIEVLSATVSPSVTSAEKMPKFYIMHCNQERKVKPFPPTTDAPATVSLATDMLEPLVLQLKGSGMLGLISTFELGRASIADWLPHSSGSKHKRTQSFKLLNEQNVEVCQVTLGIVVVNLREEKSPIPGKQH